MMSGSQKFQIQIRPCSEIFGSGSAPTPKPHSKRSKKILLWNELEAFTTPTRINIVKVLNKDPKIIQLLEKTKIRIHFDSGKKSPNPVPAPEPESAAWSRWRSLPWLISYRRVSLNRRPWILKAGIRQEHRGIWETEVVFLEFPLKLKSHCIAYVGRAFFQSLVVLRIQMNRKFHVSL